MKAVGGGAVVGGSDRVRINAAVPGPEGFTVLAVEPSGGAAEQWQLIVTATCAPAASVPGLQYVSAFSATDSAGHSATVECPAGRRLIGMGGLVDSNNIGQDRLTLAGIRPDAGLTALSAVGAETVQGFTGYWRVKATAVCASPIAGLTRIVVASTGFDSTSPKLVRAACPVGTTVLSAGFDVYGSGGAAAVSTYFPDLDLAGAPNSQGVEVTAREIGTGFSGSWWLAGYGICAY